MKSLPDCGCVRSATRMIFALSLSLVAQQAEASVTTQRASAASASLPGADLATPSPSGFTNFRIRFPEEVRDSAPAYATQAQVDLARNINSTVNERITWRETNVWSVKLAAPAYGDCVDIALTKRHELRAHGVPDGALRAVIVYAKEEEEKHMILQLRTANQIYVLDSLPNDSGENFYDLAATPASYVIIQYQMWGKPTQWMAPSSTVAENLRKHRGRIFREDGTSWVHGLHDQRSRQTLAAHRPRHD